MMLDHPHDVDELVKTNVQLMSNVAIIIEGIGAGSQACQGLSRFWLGLACNRASR